MLTDVRDLPLVDHPVHFVRQFFLSLLPQVIFQLETEIEMVFDGCLPAPCYDNHVANSGGIRFFHRVLNQGFVDERQHLLRHSFGGREKPRPQTRCRKHRLSHLSHVPASLVFAAANESSTAACRVFAKTDFQKMPSCGIRFRPRIASSSGTNTYSVSHWLIMKSVNPASALSTASVPSRCPKMISRQLGGIARRRCRGSLQKTRRFSHPPFLNLPSTSFLSAFSRPWLTILRPAERSSSRVCP